MIFGRAVSRLRNETVLTLQSTDGWLSSALSSGQSVSRDSAMRLSAYFGACRVLSDSMGKLPIHVFRDTGKGKKHVTDHPLNYLLNTRPNARMSPFMMKKVTELSALNHGLGLIYVGGANSGRINELLPLPGWLTTPYRHSDGSIWYIVQLETGEMRKFSIDEVCVLPYLSYDGYTGLSLLSAAREALGTDQAAQGYAGKFYANGARPIGVIEAPNKADEASKTKIRESFERLNAGIDNAFRVAIFDMGMKYTQLSLGQKDAQFIESRQFTVEEMSRFSGVPLFKLAAGKQAYNSNEQQGIEYVVNTLQPIVTQWEQEMTYKLFTASEIAKGYYLKINMAAEMRGDNAARAAYYEKMESFGIYNVDECRGLEDLPPLPNNAGQTHFITRNLMPLEQAAKGADPNAGQT